MTRLATLDVGSNTVLLLVADCDESGVRVIEEKYAITRLGEGVSKTGALGKDPMARTLNVLSEFNDARQALGAEWAGAVATSAAREASNGRIFAIMASAVGIPLQIISGEDEAALTALSVARDMPPGAVGDPLVIDVGGGSTEFIWRDQALSVPIGSVKLTEQFSPDTPGALAQLRAHVRESLQNVPRPTEPFSFVGVAATVTTLAMMAQQTNEVARAHHARLSLAQIEKIFSENENGPAARANRVGLDPRRADVIVAGTAIVAEAMAYTGAKELWVCDRGVRWGLLWAALAH